MISFYSFLKSYLVFILAALGRRCGAWVLSGCDELGAPLSLRCVGFLGQWLYFLQNWALGTGLLWLWCMGLGALWHVESS